MKEKWKEIKGYEGIYEVSNHGRVRSVKGKTTHSVRHGIRVWEQRILKVKGYTPKTGYRISLWKDKKQKDFLVARLVAFNFFDEDINNRKLTVNHKDGNRMNNHISNLELMSLADNIRHGFETGLYACQKETKFECLKTGKVKIYRSIALAERENNITSGRISKYKSRFGNNFTFNDFKVSIKD